ncbi:MAG: cobalt-precorrin-6A reductase [Pseudomonadota bacterium]
MTILVLSGTREGREIAQALHARRARVLASLAGATRNPRPQDVPTRIGGFGGADGFADFLVREGIRAVLDATHPFAASMTARSAAVCHRMGVPYCLFQRPPWGAGPKDDWTPLAKEEDAAHHIRAGATVFLATGRQTLHRYANLAECYLICRQIDEVNTPFPFPNGEYLIGNPPFSVEEEVDLFQKRKIDWLIVKNAGGAASFSKLEAARYLGIKVGMIERPGLPDVLLKSDIEDAISWALHVDG